MRSTRLVTAVGAVLVAAAWVAPTIETATEALVSVIGSAVHLIRTPPVATESPDGVSLIVSDVDNLYVSPDNSVLPVWSQTLALFERLLVPFVVFGLIGGLPVAVFGLALRDVRRLRGLREGVFADQSRCYAGLVFQVVSMVLSGFLLFVFFSMVPSWRDVRDGWLFLGYFALQLLVGGLALPAWRALLNDASSYRNVRLVHLAA